MTIYEPICRKKFLFVKLNNKWGIIDVNNECLTGFIFDKADVNSDEVPYYVYYYQYQKTSGIFSRRKTIYEPRLKEQIYVGSNYRRYCGFSI